MKKNIRRISCLLICFVLMWGMSISSLATSTKETGSTASTRATYYEAHYTDGNSYGTFQITTSGSVKSFTVQTQNFPSDSWIIVEIWNADGSTQLSSSYVSITGNDTIENQPLKWWYSAGTFTVKYNVHLGGSGWIGVWLY